MTISDAPHADADSAALLETRRALLREQLLRRAARATSKTPDRPVSAGQRALWLFDQMHPKSPAYNLCFAARARGPLDVAALREALAAVLAHHPLLRTRVVLVDGQLWQRLRDDAVLDFTETDLTGRDQETIDDTVLEFASRPFDLADGMLLRGAVLRVGPDDHVVLIGSHHVAADLWSFGLIMRDLQRTYPAVQADRTVVLAKPEASYDDYVTWQHGLLAGARGVDGAQFWEAQLADLGERLDLATDRPRPAKASHRAGAHSFVLDGEVSGALKRVAKQTGATPYVVLLSVFGLLMHRYTGQDDICVGSVATGRGRAAFEEVVGYFANLITIRSRFENGESFADLVRRGRDTVLDALEHQDYPFPLVVERMSDRIGGRPLFDVAFYYESASWSAARGLSLFATGAEGAAVELGEARLTPYDLPVQGDEHDLTLFVEDVDGRLHCSLRFALDLFDGDTVARMAGHFSHLAAACGARPDVPHHELPMLSEIERHQVLAGWNRPGDPTATARRGVHELIVEQSLRTPEAIAVANGDDQLTYAELVDRARALALLLRARGVGPEVTVALSGDGSPRLFVGLLAVLMAGGAYVPMDPTYPVKRLEYMAENSGVALLLTERKLVDRLPALGVPVVCLDEDHEAPVDAPALPQPRGDHLAYVIYTSGSTGRPKGVMVEHRGLVDFDDAHRESLRPFPGRRVLQNASISFDVSTWEWMMALATGATLVVAAREDLRPGPPLIETIRRERITTLSATPSVLATMDPADLPTVVELTSVGEAISADLVRMWSSGRRVVNAYGPTESTVFCSAHVCVPDGRTPPIGSALPGTELYVLDQRMRPVPVGVVGELFIGGTGVTRGYQDRPDLTADRYVPHPFSSAPGARLYRTGDRVRRDDTGNLHYLGRADHQIKIRGVRTEPGEVREVIASNPRVREAVVLAKPGPDGELTLFGYASADQNHGEPPTVGELRGYLAERLPSAMIPTYLMVLDAFPLNPNGKVDRDRLPDPAGPDAEREVGAPPATDAERLVAEVWREVLGVEHPSTDDNFFELGGHSLLAVRVSALLRERAGIELPLRELFDALTIREIAARLDVLRVADVNTDLGEADDPANSAGTPHCITGAPLPRQSRGAEGLPLSSAQQRLWFIDQLRPGDLAYRISGELWWEGPIDIAVLRAALTEVINRHEVLRTTYHLDDMGEPRQRIAEVAGELVLPVFDLAEIAEPERDAAREREAERFAAGTFDLTRSPLRMLLLALGADRYVLLLSAHHIASDGWSMRVVVRELAALYTAFADGLPSPLAEPGMQYADYAVWQRAQQDGAAGRADLDHWLDVLRDPPPALTLPTDRPRRELAERPAARVALPLSAQLTERLRKVAAAEGATLSMALLTGFISVLSRWSGMADVLVGMPVAGRNRADAADAVGLFVNTVVVRTDTSGRPSLRELLRRVRHAALDADAHQDVPFERIVGRLGLARDLTSTPLYQVVFNMLNLDEPQVRIPGVRTWLVDAPDLSARFDLTLYARPRADGTVLLDLVYDRDLFDAATVTAMLDQLADLLGSASTHPARPVDELSSLRGENLPDPAAPLPAAPGIRAAHQRFLDVAARQPDSIALTHAGGRLSYRELVDASAGLARELSIAGIGRGDRVAVQASRSAELVVALLATMRAGAAFGVLDRAYPSSRREACVRILRPSAWLECGTDHPKPQVLGEPIALARTVSVRAYSSGECPSVEQNESVDASDTAYIAFTSGTTSRPKAITARHAPLAHFVDWYARTFDVGPADRFALTSGLAHDPALRDVLVPLSLGAQLDVPAAEDMATPEQLAAWLGSRGTTVLHLTPPTARFLSGLPDGCLPALRYAFFGGDALTGKEVATLRRLAPNAALVNFYGATETPQAQAWHAIDELPELAMSPLGRGIEGSQLLVLRDDTAAGVGELGEIVVRGPYLADGYLTGETTGFTDDPHGALRYRTGDLGRYRADGTVSFAGRGDRQVKVRGHRVDLAEVEALLREHRAVSGAFADIRIDAAGERTPVAWVMCGAPVDTSELREHLRTRLPSAVVPATITVVDAFPLTANGKVDVLKLRSSTVTQPRGAASQPAATGTERRIDAIWRTLLNIDHIGRQDTFFDLGGHSLLLIRLQTLIGEEFEVGMPVVDLFRHPTIASLARAVDGRLDPSTGPGDDAREQSARRARRLAERRRTNRPRADT